MSTRTFGFTDSDDERWAYNFCRGKMSDGDDPSRDGTDPRMGACVRSTACVLSAGRLYGTADRRYALAKRDCLGRTARDEWSTAMELPASAASPGKKHDADVVAIFLVASALAILGVWFAVHARWGSGGAS